ncbi:MAG: type II CAAX endopeptidase family protein [Kiritimatiellae bacterium]|nr:type II CAAX endopeptidase family protein [Kiritimatiellia bacterium]
MPFAQIAEPLTNEALLQSADLHMLIPVGIYITLVLLVGLAVDIWLLAGMIVRARTWTLAAARALTPRISLRLVLFFAAVLFVLHLVGLLIGFLAAPESDVPLMVLQSLTLHWAVLVLTAVLLYRRGCTASSFFGLTLRGAVRDVGAGVTAFLGMMPILMLGTLLYQTLLRVFHVPVDFQDILINITEEHGWSVRAYLFFLAVVLAPLAEEVLFRGILLRFVAQRTGILGGCVLTSMLFAVIHLHVPSLAPIFILSFSLSLVYLATGSLLAAITMHMLFNAQSLGIMLLLRAAT